MDTKTRQDMRDQETTISPHATVLQTLDYLEAQSMLAEHHQDWEGMQKAFLVLRHLLSASPVAWISRNMPSEIEYGDGFDSLPNGAALYAVPQTDAPLQFVVHTDEALGIDKTGIAYAVRSLGVNPEGGCDPDDVIDLVQTLIAKERAR